MLIGRVLRALLTGDKRTGVGAADALDARAPDARPAANKAPAALPYRGYFINLDRSEDRRRDVETQLQALRLAQFYERFPAVDGRSLDPGAFKGRRVAGEAGCFLSHLRVLEAGRRDGTHLHVIEDDVILGQSIAQTLASVVDRGLLDRYDLVYTDTLVPFKPGLIRQYLRICEQSTGAGVADQIQLVNLRGSFIACHASYLVNKNSLEKVIELLAEHVRGGITLPVDLLVKNLVNEGALNAAVTLPFLTAVRLDQTLETTIHGEYEAAFSVMLHNLLRNQFFVDRDDPEFERYFREYVGTLELGQATRNIARLSAFFFSDRHRDF
jgi:GR25 family glycosyltransferase involved in LPS biosynthesis